MIHDMLEKGFTKQAYNNCVGVKGGKMQRGHLCAGDQEDPAKS